LFLSSFRALKTMAALARTPLLLSGRGNIRSTRMPTLLPSRLPARAVAPPTTSTMGRPESEGVLSAVADAGRSLEPAKLPDTPSKAPFTEERLIQMAKVRSER
jgi:hypothetical protein